MYMFYLWQETIGKGSTDPFIYPLSSVEPFSLALLSYAKMVHLQTYQVKVINNGEWWTSATYPVIRKKHDTDDRISGWEPVLNHLKEQGYNLDISLDEKQQGNLYLFSVMVTESIRDALEYYMFIEQENYHKITRRQFVNYVPYVFRFFAIDRMKDRIEKRLFSNYYGNLRRRAYRKDEERGLEFYDEASKAFRSLSSLLDIRNFFFGPNPTSLDALVFGFLAPIIYISMPKDTLRQRLFEYPNLVRYCHQMRHWLCDGIALPSTSIGMSMKDYLQSPRLLKAPKFSRKKKESVSVTNEYRKGRAFAIAVGLSIVLLYIYIRGKDTVMSLIRRQQDLRTVAYLAETPL